MECKQLLPQLLHSQVLNWSQHECHELPMPGQLRMELDSEELCDDDQLRQRQ